MICLEDFVMNCSGCCLTIFQVFIPNTKIEKDKNLEMLGILMKSIRLSIS